ncbi:MAG: helix-turn-helix transcriptional regulator [Lachnospiraceae bacterium]|nr:helix-turn-helix transcriptional regulator [Lachnospiraceae bacterium]
MMDDLKDIIKERLAELFEKETQEVTAGRLQTSQGNISKWLTGTQLITTDNLYRIARIYGVSIDWILGLSNVRDKNGLNIDALTYEQVARIMDRLIINDNMKILNHKEAVRQNSDDDYGEIESSGIRIEIRPDDNSDYIKIKDRLLSYMLRRRYKIYDVGNDMVDYWYNNSLPNFKGLKVVNNTGNMQDALDAKGWANLQDADWISLIEEISKLSEEERTALIQEIENKKKEGQ